MPFEHPDIDDYSSFLKANWDMTEADANNRLDGVGSNDAAPTGSPAIRVGFDGNACNFDHIDDYLTVTDSADVSPTTGFAAVLWVLVDDVAVQGGIFEKQSSYRILTFVGPPKIFYFDFYQSDATNKTMSTNIPALSTWYNLICVAESGFGRMYLDGSEVGTPVAYDDTIADNANNLYFGTLQGLGAWLFEGGINKASFYKNIVFPTSAARDNFALANWNGGAGRFWSPTLSVDRAARVGPSQEFRLNRVPTIRPITEIKANRSARITVREHLNTSRIPIVRIVEEITAENSPTVMPIQTFADLSPLQINVSADITQEHAARVNAAQELEVDNSLQITWESLTIVVVRSPNVFWSQGIDTDNAVRVDAAEDITADRATQCSWQLPLNVDSALRVDIIGGASFVRSARVNMLEGITADRSAPVHIAEILEPDRAARISHQEVVTGTRSAPVYMVGAINSDKSVRVSTQQELLSSLAAQLSAVQAIASAESIRLSVVGGLATTESVRVTLQEAINSARAMRVSIGQELSPTSLSADRSAPVYILAGVNADRSVRVTPVSMLTPTRALVLHWWSEVNEIAAIGTFDLINRTYEYKMVHMNPTEVEKRFGVKVKAK